MSNSTIPNEIHFSTAVIYAKKFGKIRLVQRTNLHRGSQMKVENGVIIIQKTYEKITSKK